MSRTLWFGSPHPALRCAGAELASLEVLRRSLIVAFLVCTAVAAAAPGAEAKRFHAYVSCGVGTFRPSHTCFIGDLPHAVFRDSARRSKRYKVCVRGPGRRFRFCKRRRQRRGRSSQVPLPYSGAGTVGTWTVKWWVRGRRHSIRTWRFHWAPETEG